jgi:hypothetical protein
MRLNPSNLSLLLAACTVAGAQAADVNIRVIIPGDLQPGVYGRVDFGSAPPPPVLYERPVIIVKNTRPQPVAPLYLHVPPGHAKNWSKHCQKYGACDRPVLFVRSAEYEPGYKPKKEKKEKKEKD